MLSSHVLRSSHSVFEPIVVGISSGAGRPSLTLSISIAIPVFVGGSHGIIRLSGITSGAGRPSLLLRVSIANAMISGSSRRRMCRSGITSGAGREFGVVKGLPQR